MEIFGYEFSPLVGGLVVFAAIVFLAITYFLIFVRGSQTGTSLGNFLYGVFLAPIVKLLSWLLTRLEKTISKYLIFGSLFLFVLLLLELVISLIISANYSAFSNPLDNFMGTLMSTYDPFALVRMIIDLIRSF